MQISTGGEQLWNRTRRVLLASRVCKATTARERMQGLLGLAGIEFAPGNGIWLSPCRAVHTIGMSFSIDVLYLDGDFRVIHLCRSLGPFRLGPFKLKARSVVELPAGIISLTGTSIGDRLELQNLRPPAQAGRLSFHSGVNRSIRA